MPLLDLWTRSPEQLKDKQVQQLIAFAGAGKLLDGSDCSSEFRVFLASVPSANLTSYSDQCLAQQAFQDSGLALQDIVNEMGARLGTTVTHGRYRGTAQQVGFDGLWKLPSGHSIVVEVKTSDAYRIDLDKIAGYRRALISSQDLSESNSSILLVVGRQDTGDLEAQIRGSRHAWDIRIISVDALNHLMKINEEVEDPKIVQRIHNILIPREFTRIDAIVDVLFSATEEIAKDEASMAVGDEAEKATTRKPKASPVAFHDSCVKRVQAWLGVSLVKRSRARYSSPDRSVALTCSVSKEHNPDTHPNYWFAFHPHQQEFLLGQSQSYVAFGCASSERLVLVPYSDFGPWLKNTWTTENNDRIYWHVAIYREGEKYFLRLKGRKEIDLTPYVLPTKT